MTDLTETQNLTFKDYQFATSETAIFPQEHALWYIALGLAGEAGEIANKVKKVIRDDQGQLSEEKRLSIAGELGDVLWYLSELATELDYDLGVIAETNLQKLRARKAKGVIGGSGDSR